MADYDSVMSTLVELGVFENNHVCRDRQNARATRLREAFSRNGWEKQRLSPHDTPRALCQAGRATLAAMSDRTAEHGLAG